MTLSEKSSLPYQLLRLLNIATKENVMVYWETKRNILILLFFPRRGVLLLTIMFACCVFRVLFPT